MRNLRPARTKSTKVSIAILASVIGFTACYPPGQAPILPPGAEPAAEANVVQLTPGDWSIKYSSGMPANPSADPGAAWSFKLPSSESAGHVNYVQSPFNETIQMHSVSLTFRIESDDPTYNVLDTGDILPATFHIFFEQQGDNLIEPDGRWWATPGYNLGSQDNQTLTITVPLTSDHWSNVNGETDPQRFASAWQNVGWVGITFGGQYFWGHGVALSGGTARFVLVEFQVI